MTEGIIDKVFAKYRPLRKPNGNYPYFTPKIFLQLKQELKAEIENTFTDYFNLDYYNTAVRLELLGNGEKQEVKVDV